MYVFKHRVLYAIIKLLRAEIGNTIRRVIHGVMLLVILLCSEFIFAQDMKCPDGSLSEDELVKIIDKLRFARSDIPPRYDKPVVSVSRHGCLYMVFERSGSLDSNVYQVFTIDPHGDLVDFYVNK